MKAKDEDGNTPLHIAAECGHVNIVKMMLSRGADISVVNKEKKTCLDVAIESGKEKVAEVFIGNQKEVKSTPTLTALILCCLLLDCYYGSFLKTTAVKQVHISS